MVFVQSSGTLVASVNSVNLYVLQASALIAANQAHFTAVVDRRDRQTDGQTDTGPGAYYVGSVNSSVHNIAISYMYTPSARGSEPGARRAREGQGMEEEMRKGGGKEGRGGRMRGRGAPFLNEQHHSPTL